MRADRRVGQRTHTIAGVVLEDEILVRFRRILHRDHRALRRYNASVVCVLLVGKDCQRDFAGS